MEKEVSQVKGNVSPVDMKWRCLAIFRYFVGTGSTYGADIGRRLKMVELNVWDHRVEKAEGSECEMGKKEVEAKYAETIFEINVEKGVFSCSPKLNVDHVTYYLSDMVNVIGTLHGACTAYIVDLYV